MLKSAKRKNRFFKVLYILSGVSIATVLIMMALKENINLFFLPHELVSQNIDSNNIVRVGGMVVDNSIVKPDNSLDVYFKLTDYREQIEVHYQGILPDLFREKQGIVAKGKFEDGVFKATEVLAKHDEKYMPAEIKSLESYKEANNK